MELLKESDYFKVIEPLKQNKINILFARAVVEKYVPGKIYVDDKENPKSFYVVHPYGIVLIFGDHTNSAFNASLVDYAFNTAKNREKEDWIIVPSDDWNNVIKEKFKGRIYDSTVTKPSGESFIELNTRVNFKFNQKKYAEFKNSHNRTTDTIVRTDEKIFHEMNGMVIPKYFWENDEAFCKNGIGFSLFHEGKLASTAYSAFLIEDKLELGIETVESFRGKGFAIEVCMQLIDYSLENNFEPVWACKYENQNSYKLAQKLGFEQVLMLPYYRLPV